MSEILQIFQHSPPPYHQMPPHIQRGLVNYDSQYTRSIDSGSPSPDIFDGADNFRCSEFADNSFMNFSSSSVDELSKVTAIIGHNQSSKKRKLEFDNVEIGLHEPHRTKKDTPDGNSKPKPDYIHVRARRGEATDSHSIAERARREKIKKKMQDLQDLVPGCNKIANRAAILDEIIFYVQSLQMEVEFLTMQLNASTTSLSQLLEGQLIS